MTSSKNEVKKLTRGIKRTKEEAENSNKEYVLGKKIAEETSNQIIALRAKHEDEKERFETEIKNLQERLREKDEVIEFDDKTFD